MKNFIITLLISAVNLTLFAQSREVRSVDTFSKISFSVPGKLVLRQGSPQKVELEGDKETLAKIETGVSGSKLVIENEDKWNWKWEKSSRVMVYITVPDITALSVSGSGELITEGQIKTKELGLSVTGSGYLQVEAAVAGEVDANVSGSGRLEVKGSCQNVESDISGSGKIIADITIENQLEVEISGSGKFESSGLAKEIKISITGSGKVLASNLVVDKCNARITGSGDVEINVKSELDADITGSGSVFYKGNPTHVNGHSSGSGSVRKM